MFNRISQIVKIAVSVALFFISAFITTSLINTQESTHVPKNSTSAKELIIDDKYLELNIYEHGEVKTISDMLSKGCAGNEFCEIEKSFRYVVNLPYTPSRKDRKPEDVINLNGGDCDEKSFLFASLLLEQKHEPLLIVTKDHAFVAVYVQDDQTVKKPRSRLSINGKNYYYAEMTVKEAYIGWFNNLFPSSFKVVYDIPSKREIPLGEIKFFKD